MTTTTQITDSQFAAANKIASVFGTAFVRTQSGDAAARTNRPYALGKAVSAALYDQGITVVTDAAFNEVSLYSGFLASR